MDGGNRAFVETAGRLGGDQHFGTVDEVSPEDQLLQIAARQEPRPAIAAAAAHVEAGEDLGREGAGIRPPHETQPLKTWFVEPFQNGVLPEGQLADGALTIAILGYPSDAEPHHVARSERAGVSAEHGEFAFAWTGQSRGEMGERRLAIARDADDAEGFAGPNVEIDPRQASHASRHDTDALGRDDDVAGFAFAPYRPGDPAADHQLGEFRFVGFTGVPFGDQSPSPQHQHTVGGRHHLTQLVGNEDQRQPVSRHHLQRLEKLVAFGRRQNRSGFIEHQNTGIVVERLENLDPLAFADRQVMHQLLRFHHQAEALGRRHQLAPGGGPIGLQTPEAFGARRDIIENRQVGCQGEMLMHHADAGGDRRLRSAERQFGTLHHHPALVR